MVALKQRILVKEILIFLTFKLYDWDFFLNSLFSANTTRYSCDFEKAMHCGISQITYDKGEFVMMNGSYLREKILYEEAFNEHTNNDSDGMSY